MECPVCVRDMDGRGTNYYCKECDQKYTVEFSCEKCGNQPEEISSCGSVSYFCQLCKELKSRKSMNKKIHKTKE